MALDLQQLHAELETAKANFNNWALNAIETADDTRRRHLDFIRDSKGEVSPLPQVELLTTTRSRTGVTAPPAVQMEKLMDRQQELSQQAQILKQREGLPAPTDLPAYAKRQLLGNASGRDGRLYATCPSGVCIGCMQACSRRAHRRWSCRLAWRHCRLRRLPFPGR